MAIRPHPTKGPGWWYLDIGHGKSRQRYPFEGSLAEAREIEAQIRKRQRPGPASPNPRIDEIVDDYLEHYQVDHLPNGYERQKYSIAHIRSYFGRYNLTSIEGKLVDSYKRHRTGKGVKPSTIQKELAALSGLLKWAADENMIDIAPKIKNYPARMTRAPLPKVPTLDEAQAIIAEIPEPLRGIFQVMLWCGLRSSEAMHLKHKDVMVGQRTLSIHGKGSKYRMVPVPDDDLWQAIERRLKVTEPTNWLWPNPETKSPYKDLRGTLETAAARAGYGHITPHKFRHAYGAGLIESGCATLRDVQILLGHSSSQVTEIYTQLSAGRLTTVTNGLKKKLT
jgi:integrase/recombinase XerC